MKKILALVMVLVMACSVMVITASAAESPTAPVFCEVKFVGDAESSGYCTATPANVELGGITTLKFADPQKAGFSGWKLIGDYEIISGSLEEGEIVVRVFSELSVDAIFTHAPSVTPTTAPNTSPESPQTGTLGSNSLAVYAVLLAGAFILFGVIYKVKRRA